MPGRPIVIPDGGFRHIAVLRLSSLGDVVLTLPVVHALAARFPEARLVYWVKEEYRDVVASDPAIAHVRVLERDARRIEDLVSMSAELEDCDLIVDLHRSVRSRILTFRQRAPLLRVRTHRLARERWVRARWTGPRPLPHVLARYAATLAPIGVAVDGPPRLVVSAEAERWAAAWWGAWRPGGPVVALLPGARHATKRWPEEHWVELDRILAESGIARLVCSLPAERDTLPALAKRIAGASDARWCTEPLPRMAALLGNCATGVSNDSGLMHVAAARGVRLVAMFGSTSPVFGFAPAGEGHVVLCRDEPCQPCTVHGRETCPRGHFRCMRMIGPEEVRRAVEGMIPVRSGV
ncbi:MAG: glycosyltransferase family 9 protein [Candidatus Eisenbacteria bacterium]